MITRILMMLTLYVISELVTSELTGDHICEKEEKYSLNVTKHFLRNITVRSYEWCVQVPPRCSTYTVQQINDTKTEEEERFRYVKRCCDGYYVVDEGKRCAPNSCRYCKHGYCDEDGICRCDAGYWGSNCEKECVENCQNKCNDCNEGRCDTRTGNCLCPPKFIRCDLICTEGHPNGECFNECKCDNICDPFTKKCIRVNKNITEYDDYEDFSNYKLVKNKSTFPTRWKYESEEATTMGQTYFKFTAKSSTENAEIEDSHFRTDTSKDFNEKATTTIETTERGTNKLHINKEKPEISTIENLLINVEASTEENVSKHSISPEITTKSLVFNDVTNANTTFIAAGNMYSNKSQESNATQSSNESSHRIPIDSHLFITIISGAFFTMLIIISAAVFCVLYKLKEKKKKYINATDEKVDCKINQSVSSVSVTAKSIFHTPLPDPPVFENPAFLIPLDGTLNKQARTFETHVICNMNFPKLTSHNQIKQDSPEIFYDHPPSTGSYRAASIPEPPISECEKIGFDPIYDEIPCNRRVIPVTPPPSYVSELSTMYMNIK